MSAKAQSSSQTLLTSPFNVDLRHLHLRDLWFDLPPTFVFPALISLSISVEDFEGLNCDLLHPEHLPSLRIFSLALYNWAEVDSLTSTLSLLAPQLRTLCVTDSEGDGDHRELADVLPHLTSLQHLKLHCPAAKTVQAISAIPSPLLSLHLDAQSAGLLLETQEEAIPPSLRSLQTLGILNPDELRIAEVEEWCLSRGVRLEEWDGGEQYTGA